MQIPTLEFQLSQPSPDPRRPALRTMATSEPWAVGYHSTTTATLSTDIKSLTALKDTAEATHVREVCESVIVILALVRVGLFTPFPLSHPLIGEAARM